MRPIFAFLEIMRPTVNSLFMETCDVVYYSTTRRFVFFFFGLNKTRRFNIIIWQRFWPTLACDDPFFLARSRTFGRLEIRFVAFFGKTFWQRWGLIWWMKEATRQWTAERQQENITIIDVKRLREIKTSNIMSGAWAWGDLWPRKDQPDQSNEPPFGPQRPMPIPRSLAAKTTEHHGASEWGDKSSNRWWPCLGEHDPGGKRSRVSGQEGSGEEKEEKSEARIEIHERVLRGAGEAIGRAPGGPSEGVPGGGREDAPREGGARRGAETRRGGEARERSRGRSARESSGFGQSGGDRLVPGENRRPKEGRRLVVTHLGPNFDHWCSITDREKTCNATLQNKSEWHGIFGFE